MIRIFKTNTFYIVLVLLLTQACSPKSNERETEGGLSEDALPSWNNTEIKNRIISYVEGVTNPSLPEYIKPEDRIACFDNDGTLWSEKPIYFQFYFVFDQIKKKSKEHPEWKNQQPYKAILEGDHEALMNTPLPKLLEAIQIALAGDTPEAYKAEVKAWIDTAKHPTKKVRFDQLVYQPMLELLDYLRANDFKTYIVSGGGLDFMRGSLIDVYNIPSEQILGSTLKTEFIETDSGYVIIRQPELDFIDDKDGKPININRVIGKKPVICVGNSDGDLAMLQWTSDQEHKNLEMIIHHTDSVREWAYDRDSKIGHLDKALDQAKADDWVIVSMKEDWKVIYPQGNSK
ncbi:HAD family hydrolase [Aureibacter tunicatorum]|uniref:phosphoserine phosphatase n=1 Tax=Aureibacter tunicatorum TaxID=866807 RepID=A0AAE3XJI5_9BACT|nr:HAD family hydrolase [Aureibacter tunicatorum]MDR6238037.1 hypothetical protein [Aureibacter tunicatorum]BDD03070.1 haloacid dehalogenase [Aureibacter tunicatorum]